MLLHGRRLRRLPHRLDQSAGFSKIMQPPAGMGKRGRSRIRARTLSKSCEAALASLAEAEMSSVGDDQVVDDPDAQQLSSRCQTLGDDPVFFARRWISAWMVVDQ